LEIERKARALYRECARRTKRIPYVRSAYFKKDKIFLNLFWSHINQKPRGERMRRIKYYQCALDLLRNTPFEPETRQNPNGKNELVHRFAGMTHEGDLFYVQVKEDKRHGNKHFMSVFPPGHLA